MLRTQEAALYAVGAAGIGDLCEAVCLDAVEVVRARRVSIWFFAPDGSLVCQRMVDAADGRIQQGAVIPSEATAAYLDAASQGLKATVTDSAPALHGDSAADASRLDLLLVDGENAPAAVFRCERQAGAADWSERDLYLLRRLVQTLAAALRRHCNSYQGNSHLGNSHQAPRRDKAVAPRDAALPGMGMIPQDLGRLGLDPAAQRPQPAIRLPDPLRPALPEGEESRAALSPDKGWIDEGEC